MKSGKFIRILLVLGILTCGLASLLSAEKLQQRITQGNNVGLRFRSGFSAPLGNGWNTTDNQFPKGSTNTFGMDGGGMCMCTTRDLDNDGVPEDTMYTGFGREMYGWRADLESYAMVEELFNQGLNLQNELSNIRYTRIWSSTDPDDLADWPVGGRVDRDPSGEVVTHGNETLFATSSDVFNTAFGPPSGFNQEWSIYALDFGESKNMIYLHIRFQNVTEYVKFNYFEGYRAVGEANPDGWDWNSALLYWHHNVWNWGGASLGGAAVTGTGWAYHPAKEIFGHFYKGPSISSFIPQYPPLMGLVVLRRPQFNGDSLVVANVQANSSGEFGIPSAPSVNRRNFSAGKVYRVYAGIDEEVLPGVTNPFTGKSPTYGYPGMLEPSDARYDQWLWGGNPGYYISWSWGELHDVAPRDTFSIDMAYMFANPGVTPLALPAFDVSQIDNQMMQDYFAPLENAQQEAFATIAGGFITPMAPPRPALTIIPGDRQVTITWSDISVDTKDPYYAFLVENGFPTGNYREQDFEGFRLYRNFYGPTEAHIEQLGDFNISENSLRFHYVDKLEDDRIYSRMRNGMRVWYAVEAYDKNYDRVTDEEISLPAPGSGKVWNRQGEGIYNVQPRSNASNYKESQVTSIAFTPYPATAVVSDGVSATLAGQDGLLTEAPRYLEPGVEIEFVPVITERITSALSVSVRCSDWAPNGSQAGRRYVTVETGTGNVVAESRLIVKGWGDHGQTSLAHNEGMSADGVTWALTAEFDVNSHSTWYTQIDPGSYSGATIDYIAGGLWDFDWNNKVGMSYHGDETNKALCRAGEFVITWKTASGGLTLQVMDNTRGVAVPFSPYIDNMGWGFMPPGEERVTYHNEWGIAWGGPDNVEVPQSERSTLLVETVPANNTEEFNIWIDGQIFAFDGITAMPSDGTQMVVRCAFGDWSGDTFIQYADAPAPGEFWKIDVSATTLNPEDTDLSKIRVVPNPYVASSFLDQSPAARRIEFINLPDRCTVRIYTLSGNLVNVLNHIGANRQGWGNYTDLDHLTDSQPRELSGYDNHGGTEPWDMKNRFGYTVASGLYLYHVTDARGKTHTGKFYIVN